MCINALLFCNAWPLHPPIVNTLYQNMVSVHTRLTRWQSESLYLKAHPVNASLQRPAVIAHLVSWHNTHQYNYK